MPQSLLVALLELTIASFASFATSVLPDGYLHTLCSKALAQSSALFDTRKLLGAPHSKDFREGSSKDRRYAIGKVALGCTNVDEREPEAAGASVQELDTTIFGRRTGNCPRS